MEMDRQTLMVLFGAIITLTLIGTNYLAKPSTDPARPVYADEDIRHKLQKDEAKQNGKTKRRAPPQDDSSSDEASENEEPPAEEPSID